MYYDIYIKTNKQFQTKTKQNVNTNYITIKRV